MKTLSPESLLEIRKAAQQHVRDRMISALESDEISDSQLHHCLSPFELIRAIDLVAKTFGIPTPEPPYVQSPFEKRISDLLSPQPSQQKDCEAD